MIVAEGSIADRPFPRTFAAIAARAFTGELIVTSGGREYRIGWRDGAVVGATSPHPADSAAKIAVTLGVLSSTQASEVARVIAANAGCDEVEVVARVARLTSEMVGRLARRLAATRAARIFSIESGEFQLDDTPPMGAITPVDPRWIMYSGVRTHYTIDRLHREVSRLAGAIEVPEDADLSAFGFGEGEADIVARVRGARLNLLPPPADLDGRVVEAIALVLLSTGVAAAVAGDPIPMASPAVPASPRTRVTSSSPPRARDASTAIPRPRDASTAIPRPRDASTAISQPRDSSTAISQPRDSSTASSRPPDPSTAIPRPRDSSTAIPRARDSSTAIPRARDSSTAIPRARDSSTAIPRAGTAIGVPPMRSTSAPPVGTSSSHASGPIEAPRTMTGPIPAQADRRSTGSIPVPPPRTMTTQIAVAPPPRTSTGSIAPPPSSPGRPRHGARSRVADPARALALIAERKAALESGADHFAMLSLTSEASVEEVRTAYFELARYLHPDRLAAAGLADERREAHRVFARINEAFGVLSDPDRRAEYVRTMRAGGAHVVAAAADAAAAKVREVIGGEEAYRKGEMALRRMELELAITQFQAAVELSPEEADHHAMLGWAIYVAAPDKAAALPLARGHLRKAVELSVKAHLPHLFLGRIARMEGEATAAVNHLRQAVDLAPHNPEAAAELRAAEAMKARSSSRPGLFSRPKK
ncbi:MAG: DnaJ domain-containing protein [Myxococcales bacterium]|nr:DnaJ domain-containing protein [Myxococcales bacterium]